MSNARRLRLEVILSAIDKLGAPFRAATNSSSTLARSLKATRDRLAELKRTQGDVDAFRNLSRDAAITSRQLQAAQERVRGLAQQVNQAVTPTAALNREFRTAVKEAQALKQQQSELTQRLGQVRTRLDGAGISTAKLGQHQRTLKTQLAAANTAFEQQAAAMARVNEQQKRMNAARAQYSRQMQTRNDLMGTGAGATAAGAAMALPVIGMVKAYSSFEDAMLGVARQVEGARDSNGKLTATYFQMGTEIQRMAERIPMATTEIAALVEAGARMGIQGRDNLLAFAETTAISATAFDLPADQIGEDIGKIANLYKVPIKSISELGDAINWLDDNAQSKGADIINVLQRMGGVADKLDYRKAAALGSTFLSLGTRAEVAASAANAMVRELSIASMQGARFQGGIKTLALDAKELEKSMSKDAMGTITSVLEAIKKLPADQQMTVTTQLFGKEFGDDAAKLANNLPELYRQLKLVNDEESRGSMLREAQAKNATLSAQYQMAQNRLFNTQADLGKTLRPQLMSIMDAVSGVLTRIRDWVNANPALTGTLVKVLAVVAMIVTAFGAVTLALAAMIGPFAIARYGMAMLAIRGTSLLPVLKLVSGAIMAIGRALLMNPIGLLITGIAVAALLIYTYWEPIKAFFSGLWSQVQAAFQGGIGSIAALILNWSPLGLFYSAFAGVLSWFGIELPAKFTEFGANLLQGLINGITGMLGALQTTISNVATGAANWFKEKLGIHSPSRVFAELGGYTMEGLDQGIAGGQNGPLSTVAAMAQQLTAAGANMLFGGDGGGVRFDQRPPLAAGAAGAAGGGGGMSPVTINIYPEAGMDVSALAAMVRREFEAMERERRARGRSRLADSD